MKLNFVSYDGNKTLAEIITAVVEVKIEELDTSKSNIAYLVELQKIEK